MLSLSLSGGARAVALGRGGIPACQSLGPWLGGAGLPTQTFLFQIYLKRLKTTSKRLKRDLKDLKEMKKRGKRSVGRVSLTRFNYCRGANQNGSAMRRSGLKTPVEARTSTLGACIKLGSEISKRFQWISMDFDGFR